MTYAYCYQQRTARRELSSRQKEHLGSQLGAQDEQRQRELHAQQISEVERALNMHRQQQIQTESKLKEGWKVRDRELWKRIESVIKLEEDKVAKLLEEERRKREEEDRIRKEAEARKRLAEEKALQEETAKRKAEEEKRRKEEEEVQNAKKEEEERKKLEDERKRKLAEEVGLRKTLAFNSADDDWRVARENLLVSCCGHRIITWPYLFSFRNSNPVPYASSSRRRR